MFAPCVVGMLTDKKASNSCTQFDPAFLSCCCIVDRAVLCLVMGSIYRVKGGVPLQSMMRAAVESLVAVASRPIGVAHVWALHGLWLVAGAAGAGYAAHVKQSLQLALELLVGCVLSHFKGCMRLSTAYKAVDTKLGRIASNMTCPLLLRPSPEHVIPAPRVCVGGLF